jgi:lipopolysaccharide/colanic/teichoic acid biosynthesis glycosyltransferase
LLALHFAQSATEDQMNRFEARDSNKDFIALKEHGETYSPIDLESTGVPVDSWRYAYLKRALDLFVASGMLVVLAIPGCLIAAVVLGTSGWPLFYREERIGRYGRPFRIWKFRSMRINGKLPRFEPRAQADGDHLTYRASKNTPDPRITFVGRFLRRWSLDELPQIFNVLRGEMSLVGPRPIIEKETRFYDKLLPYYLSATPGLSGLWQVSGRSNIDYPKRAQLDAAYVMEWSLRTDFRILMQTLPAVLKRTGAR